MSTRPAAVVASAPATLPAPTSPMSSTSPTSTDRVGPAAARPADGLAAGRWRDAAVGAGFLAIACWIYHGLWLDLERGYLVNSGADQSQWEWYATVVATAVAQGDNPLATDLQNYPEGVNLAANAVMLGLTVPLAPVTLLFGATLTWAIVLTGGLAGTATGWYWVFSRELVPSRVAAALGGAFCGFAPPMISHANAHPNFVVLFVLPFVALTTVRIARGERVVRRGVVLGLLVAWQVLLGEEPLVIFALTFAVFGIAWVVPHRRSLRVISGRLAAGLGIGAAVTLAVVGFPLYWQFFGPQSFHSLLHGELGNDTTAFTHFATESVAGVPEAAAAVSLNRTEENAFFGWPLVGLLAALTFWLWRDVTARALAIAAIGTAYLSLGVEVTVSRDRTGIPGPWRWLGQLPLLDSVIESRLAMGCIPTIGGLLAIATHRVLVAARTTDASAGHEDRSPLRLLWAGALLAALVPIAPTPLLVEERPRPPPLVTDGTWRDHVDDDGTLVPVPLPSTGRAEALHWQVAAGLGFRLPEGYFVGPWGPGDRRGRYGATPRPTSALLAEVERSGQVPLVTASHRAAALADLRHWNADLIVLAPALHGAELLATLDALLPVSAEYVAGAWVWDTRRLTP